MGTSGRSRRARADPIGFRKTSRRPRGDRPPHFYCEKPWKDRSTLLQIMIVLALAGIVLLVAAPLIARLVVGRGGDPTGLKRILQVIAAGLLIGALFARPYNRDTTAVPPPPDADTRGP